MVSAKRTIQSCGTAEFDKPCECNVYNQRMDRVCTVQTRYFNTFQ